MQAHPLSWPIGWPRAKRTEGSRFKVTFSRSRDSLMSEIRKMGGRDAILSTNIPLRIDGLPYANFKAPEDKGVAVYFNHKGKSMSFACDRWNKIEDNVWSIAKTIEALRGIERWGASDMIEKAFSGFTSIAPPSEDWWDVLGVSRDSSVEEIKRARNLLARENHPDLSSSTSSQEAMIKINKAFEDGINFCQRQ
jgi:hypothetical protein